MKHYRGFFEVLDIKKRFFNSSTQEILSNFEICLHAMRRQWLNYVCVGLQAQIQKNNSRVIFLRC